MEPLFLFAVKVFFMSCTHPSANPSANRTTIILADELLCITELLSWGLMIILERIIGIFARGTAGHILTTAIGAVVPLAVSLRFSRCFLKQLQPGSPAIDIIDNWMIHLKITIIVLVLLGFGSLLGASYYMLSTRPRDEEDYRRRLAKLRQLSWALFDSSMCFLVALFSHALCWKILGTISLSQNIAEAGLDQENILDHIGRISRVRKYMGWFLLVRDVHAGTLGEDLFPRWFLQELNGLGIAV